MSEPLDLEPIKARLAAATPGPWEYDDDGFYGVVRSTEPEPSGWRPWVCGGEPDEGRIEPGGDADLIANAPTDLAALIAEVERLRGVIVDARSACATGEGCQDPTCLTLEGARP